MTYYDIHTHTLPKEYKENVVSIFNSYPLEYELYKDIENPNLYFSSGIHPWYLTDLDKQIEVLEKVVNEKRVVAIGEAGLDKLCGTDWILQEYAFRKQIEISIENDKPLVIHCVKAWDELIALYKEYKPTNKWIIHGFRGKGQQAKQFIELGFKLSFGEMFNPSTIESITFDSIFFESDDSSSSIVSICSNFVSCCDLMKGNILAVVSAEVVKTFRL